MIVDGLMSFLGIAIQKIFKLLEIKRQMWLIIWLCQAISFIDTQFLFELHMIGN